MGQALFSTSLGHRFGELDREEGGRFYVEPGHLRLARNSPGEIPSRLHRLAFSYSVKQQREGKKEKGKKREKKEQSHDERFQRRFPV